MSMFIECSCIDYWQCLNRRTFTRAQTFTALDKINFVKIL